MRKHIRNTHSLARHAIVATLLLFLAASVSSAVAAGARRGGGGAGRGDPPTEWRDAPTTLTCPSVVKGKPAGIEVGQYPPDFQLQPVQVYADLNKWLGEKAPKKAEDVVMISDLVGKAPVLLLFGSYT